LKESIGPSEGISKSPIGTPGDNGREARQRRPQDPRWVPSPEIDRQIGGDGEAQGALPEPR
jgi:hypothetical protein